MLTTKEATMQSSVNIADRKTQNSLSYSEVKHSVITEGFEIFLIGACPL